MRKPVLILLALCLALPASALADLSYLSCADADTIYARVNQSNGSVQVIHEDAIYNCCPDPARFTITTTGQTVRIEEQVTETNPCDCYCCFDLSVTVDDLSPGQWTVIYAWLDLETWTMVEREFAIFLPETATGETPVLVNMAMSGCLEVAAVPEEIIEFSTWCWIKSIYR